MAFLMRTANRIHRIVRLRQMLRNWRNKAKPVVPAGHVAIYAAGRRFVIRAIHLNHPVFAKLLSEAEEEYGFGDDGPLKIPCEESVFEDVIRVASGSIRKIGCGKAAAEFRPSVLDLVQKQEHDFAAATEKLAESRDHFHDWQAAESLHPRTQLPLGHQNLGSSPQKGRRSKQVLVPVHELLV